MNALELINIGAKELKQKKLNHRDLTLKFYFQKF